MAVQKAAIDAPPQQTDLPPSPISLLPLSRVFIKVAGPQAQNLGPRKKKAHHLRHQPAPLVIEADDSSGLVKYARLCEGDADQDLSLGELEEVTLDEACAVRAHESVEANALEVDALIRQADKAVTVVLAARM
jgi:hypothetical protein